jgi:D-glycero-alpha-D-manno-heptose-7-phosphate kinase
MEPHAVDESDVKVGADSLLARAATRYFGLKGVRTRIRSNFPTGAGLGGSSSVGVALVGACRTWLGRGLDNRSEIAEESRLIEVEQAGIAGGRQDHYAAAYGGALDLTFGNVTTAHRIPLSASTIRALEQRCVIVFSGQSRISADTIKGVLSAYEAGDAQVTDALHRIKWLAADMTKALAGGDLDALGAAVGEHWVHQRRLHPAITTERIDTIVDTAARAGAIGSKALGASGGGCVLVIGQAGAMEGLRAAVGEVGLLLDFEIDQQGVTVMTEDHV